jgi:hypothetical protein
MEYFVNCEQEPMDDILVFVRQQTNYKSSSSSLNEQDPVFVQRRATKVAPALK